MNFSARMRSAFLPSSGSRFLSCTTATAFEPAHSRYSTAITLSKPAARRSRMPAAARPMLRILLLSLGGIWLRIER